MVNWQETIALLQQSQPTELLETAYKIFEPAQDSSRQQGDRLRALVLVCVLYVGRSQFSTHEWSDKAVIRDLRVPIKLVNRAFTIIAVAQSSQAARP